MHRRPLVGLAIASAAAALAFLGLPRGATERPIDGEPDGGALRLSAGQERRRTIGADDRHRYLIALRPGQFLSLVVDQQGIDVVVTLFGPGGERLFEVDSPNGEVGREALSWLATEDGDHRVEVHPLGEPAQGRYTVRVEAVRPATPEDRHRCSAARLRFEAKESRRTADGKGLSRAAALYEQARRESAAATDRYGEALALERLGQTLPRLHRNEEAMESYRLSAAVYDQLGEAREAALVLSRLGRLCRTTGRLDEGREAYRGARERFRSLGDRRHEASMLHNLALLEDAAGLRWQAQTAYREALGVWHALGAHDEEATTLTNLGDTYVSLGQLKLARDAFAAALRLRSNPTDQGTTLNGLAVVHRRLDQPERALELLDRALEMQTQIGDRQGEAVTRNNLGLTYFHQNRYEPARREYEAARELFRQVDDRHSEAYTTLNLAWLWDKVGEPGRSLEDYRRALPVFVRLGDLDGEASALYGIAQAEAHRGRLGPAAASAQAALDRVESVRFGAQSQALRTSYLAAKHHYYELAVELAMRQHEIEPDAGHDVTAFLTSERSRARSLLDTLSQRPVQLQPRPDPSLQASLRHVEKRLADAQNARLTATDMAAGAALDQELRQLSAELDRLRTLARLQSSLAAPSEPRPVLHLEALQGELDGGTVVLEYFLGEERSFLWMVSRDALLTRTLPSRSRIDWLARRFHELLAAGPTRGLQAQTELVGAALSDALLGPLQGSLEAECLVIVPHGSLEYVAFAALPIPWDPARRPLIAEYELVSVPSAATLVELRRKLPLRKPPPGWVAVVADPVYGRDDPRVKRTAPAAAGVTDGDPQSAGPLTGALPRLPGTHREAERLLSLAPPSKRFAALGFAANRETVLGGELARYRIVHFATHGLLDAEHPELSGLVLSRVDPEGRRQPGILWSHEIHDLHLPVDLVVLSACRTALGREIRGEGMTGLTRGFFDAGAERVVVSLWGVGDEATGKLMERFYQGLLVQGLPPSAALRQAQLDLWTQPRWHHPSDWAGFLLQGEWR